jgi:hypothetical protein
MAVGLTDLAELRTRAGGNKYGAEPQVVDGVRFASKAEARRFAELVILERTGAITDLRLQPAFELQPAFVDNKGRRQSAIRYHGDFLYVERDSGKVIVEEIKGFMDTAAALRIRLFLYKHREVEFRLIRTGNDR